MRQFLTFGALGGAGTALHFAVLFAAVEWAHWPAMAGTMLGALCGMLFNYLAHYHITFASDAPHRRALPLFATGAAVSFALNALIMAGLLGLKVQYLLAQLCTTGIVFVLNYVFAKHVAFRK